VERPWSFDGDGETFKLAVEAKRIDLAFLFDPMMAVHTSNVEPLPHQITAVYESMLPRQPLRFVLADDPGAGKTIMAGLYIRELIMRADARRILIVAPGSLVEQWRDELFEKFGLEFRVFSRETWRPTPSGNPFEDHDHLIVRLDQMSRNSTRLQEKLCARWLGSRRLRRSPQAVRALLRQQARATARFNFAEKLGANTRHLLLMTATPHNGKEEDFQLFLSLLDSDRFYGKFRDGVHKVDTLRPDAPDGEGGDGEVRRHPAVPRAQGVHRQLQALRPEGRALRGRDALRADGDGQGRPARGQPQGLGRLRAHRPAAAPRLQPRGHLPVAAPPRERLERRLREEKARRPGQASSLAETLPTVPEDDDDLNAEEQEGLEETWSIRPPPLAPSPSWRRDR
jgi:hypothetical protein